MSRITLAHGNGGEESHNLIENIFYKYFNNDELIKGNDSGVIKDLEGDIVVSTDSFVVSPLFFKGGDIGKLSVCGTINDIVVSGGMPVAITVAFIIEEGFLISDLEKIVKSLSEEANRNNVKIISGDTKVVEKGKGDKLYINTTGIGFKERDRHLLDYKNIRIGDKIIVSGTLGDHGMAIIGERDYLEIESKVESDCGSLKNLVFDILEFTEEVRVMRDPSRGGLVTTLKELVNASGKSMIIKEKDIPIREDVNNLANMLGMDPLYLPNEGKLVCIVSKEKSKEVLNLINNNPLGRYGKIIGEVVEGKDRKLYLETVLGGKREMEMARGEQIPRIC